MTEPLTIHPDDARYRGLISGSNTRWTGSPDYIRLVWSTEQVVEALQQAVDANLRVVVRSGGHCDEDFTANADVQAVIDVSGMDAVYYDDAMGAFAVAPGATLGRVYSTLYKGWGVTLPGGTCPTVGAGGHVAGAGYGALSRVHGLIVDHLYAVEVVVVGADGKARAVVATRESEDPHRDLWWAHTGAGGGNFGIVTRYWFRSPEADGDDPTRLLPTPPTTLIVSDVSWGWDGLDEAGFARLITNFGEWHERHSGPGSAHLSLYSQLKIQHRSAGSFRMSTQIDADEPDAANTLDAFLAEVGAGTGATYTVNDHSRVPWFYAVKEWFGFVEAAVARWKVKSAYMRRPLPAPQIDALYRQLTRGDYPHPYAMVALVSYGGRINAVAADATAAAQRDSILKLMYVTLWTDPAEDDRHDRWVRECYADVYAATGGVPVPGEATDGCFINYADADVADPAHNSSGVPWHRLYFKDNYPALQAAKAKWDPREIFSHRLSIRPA
jgi:FAD/FMN-containing dehydrogenase